MHWNQYRREIDSANFDPAFTARTLQRMEAERAVRDPVTMKNRKMVRSMWLAAAFAMVVCISAAAVTVIAGMDLRAQTDLGVDPASPIPEYHAYSEDSAPAGDNPESGVRLLSTMCAGSRMDAYLLLSPVEEHMGEAVQCGESGYEWDVGDLHCGYQPSTFWFSQVSYDAESQTSLVHMVLLNDALQEQEQVQVSLRLCSGQTLQFFNRIVIPVTPAEQLQLKLALPVFCGEETGTITNMTVCAGYVEFEVQIPPCEDADPKWLDLHYREWDDAITSALADAALQYADGSSARICDLESPLAGKWILSGGGFSDFEKGSIRVQHICSQALDIRQIESVIVHDEILYVD